jgi:hypothetical protein
VKRRPYSYNGRMASWCRWCRAFLGWTDHESSDGNFCAACSRDLSKRDAAYTDLDNVTPIGV